MTENVASSSTRNFERMGRPKTRARASNTNPEHRTQPTRRERRVQHLLEPGRVASNVAYKILEHHDGEVSFDFLYELAVDMDTAGVIDRHVVHDPAVRLGVITNAIQTELIDTGRLELTRKREEGRYVHVLTLSKDERSVHRKELLIRERKKEQNRQDRQARRDAARAEGKPTPMNRRDRKRQAEKQSPVERSNNRRQRSATGARKAA